MSAFEIHDLKSFNGPSYHLSTPALVFLLETGSGCRLDAIREGIVRRFPSLSGEAMDTPPAAFLTVLMHILRLDLELYIKSSSLVAEGDRSRIAVEYLDEGVAREAIYITREWLSALCDGRPYDFDQKFHDLQADFNKTFFGGPTLYSLIEGGLKRGMPVHYLREENQFQWGYGRKHVRGRSTTFHTDGIKDTEFTTFKDMCKDFLETCGFPTPKGRNCWTEREIEEEATQIGFPVVVKPVAGHKGQGVTTGIMNVAEARRAYRNIFEAAKGGGGKFDGVIVEKQITGTDHRLLAVKGKFAAALQRIPAYVDGNGKDDIQTLVEKENSTPARIDNARSPLCRIKIDEDLLDFLRLQSKTVQTVPAAGERVFLRRVANISAGGVSINVTDKIHPLNVKLVEDIAGFFQLTCLGIDVLADDIGKPWNEGNFGIIEINAAPGVFMHLAPAIGGSLDVPGMILRSHFPREGCERIPIVVGNRLTSAFCDSLRERLEKEQPQIGVGSLTEDGIAFDGKFFHKHPDHDQNVKIVLRNPRIGFAIFNHASADISERGLFHRGHDVAILESPTREENVLRRDLMPGGVTLEVREREVAVLDQKGATVGSFPFGGGKKGKETAILEAMEPILPLLLSKYERRG